MWFERTTGSVRGGLRVARCAVIAVGLLGLLSGCDRTAQPAGPATFLWSWERPDDLLFIDPTRVGVAFLAATVRLEGDGVETRPRWPSFRVPFGTALIAVVRIEGSGRGPVEGSQAWDEVLRCLVDAASLRQVGGLQIDFDAAVSQRRFYRSLLRVLRTRLPQGFPLSITALASWCLGDPWIADLPVDEVVPMLFQMGRDGEAIRAALASGHDFGPALCRCSVGLSTEETLPVVPPGRRQFVFHPVPWSPSTVRRILENSP